jgi:N-sulfoglucosamine sulfohydrolase
MITVSAMDRRGFVKRASVLAAGAWSSIAVTASSAPDMGTAPERRPNILFAIADDWSWPHGSAYGATCVKTPAFDRVAREGCLFTNAFVVAPQCPPSRAALLTGRNIWQLEEAGTHWSTFPAKFAVYPDILEAAGYYVGYTGKG